MDMKEVANLCREHESLTREVSDIEQAITQGHPQVIIFNGATNQRVVGADGAADVIEASLGRRRGRIQEIEHIFDPCTDPLPF